MHRIQLGQSDLRITPICLGTMAFGEQVDEPKTHTILDHLLTCDINFIDTAEMYSAPIRPETFTLTETIIGNWIARNPAARKKIVLSTKVCGPAPGMPWIRGGKHDLTAEDIEKACNDSLKRLQTDYIDLYQIHWPVRQPPAFGGIYFDPSKDNLHSTSILTQLHALGKLVQAGKIRAIGLSNETCFGVHEFIKQSELHQLPRIASVQNAYSLLNRSVENALDEMLYRLNIGLLGFSPLAGGLLTGKYDHETPCETAEPLAGSRPASGQKPWGRHIALKAAARYNALARENGLTPTQMALAFSFNKWQVTSTIIGVTSIAQFNENLEALSTKLSPEVLAAIDEIRFEYRDPPY